MAGPIVMRNTLYNRRIRSCVRWRKGNKVSLKPGIPSVKAQDEDLVDPQQTLREQCNELPKCTDLYEKYAACNDRVNSRKKTAEICSEELFDYLHCVDACVTETLFSHLK